MTCDDVYDSLRPDQWVALANFLGVALAELMKM